MGKIKNLNDVMAGSVLILVALFSLTLSWRLNSGTAAAMGPGYVPKLLAFILIALGGATVFYGVFKEGEPFEAWVVRPLFWILAAVTFFAFAIERLGLVLSVVGVVLISCLAHKGTGKVEASVLAFGMAAFAVIVFVKALGLPILVWPAALVR